jgi:hypothetical protein
MAVQAKLGHIRPVHLAGYRVQVHPVNQRRVIGGDPVRVM